ncbi:hypothetical protein PRUPE_6G186900 [Prunus persica]|uniref:Uncharacterized protein n=1 Tax=Prunus persica TaxID=3760 RepID=A0A251NSL2_PRUPE|nr:uncharacterized protein LOC109949536 isoform X2 [Prunus persica]ONI02248.1 hypothetical protein PRUPE_6G186900 [Prunus persica]
MRVQAENSSIGRLGKRKYSPKKRARNLGSRLAESLRRALEEQRKAEQRKDGGGGKVGQPTIPMDGDPDPLRVIPPSTPSLQPTIVLNGDGSTEKDRDMDTSAVELGPKKRRVNNGDINQHQANFSGLRIHSAFTLFFRTCQLSICNSKLEGFEGKSHNGKINMTLQATLEATCLQYHA